MSSHPLSVLHTSDYQVGRPFVPDAAEAMIRLAEEVGPDVLVAAGDLTQRAKVGEYEQVGALLRRFGDVPLVLTPGNHDVPLYRTLERLSAPYRNWRRFTGRHELDTVTHVPGATFVALCSAAPRRAIVAGRLRARQLAFAHESFAEAPVHDHRILVVHHHFIPVADGAGGRPLAGAASLLAEVEDMGASAVLGGHVHQLHVRTSSDVTGRPAAVPVIATGTATSRRGRAREAGANSLCVLRFDEDAVEVQPYLRRPGAGEFEPLAPRSFELGARRARPPRRAGDPMGVKP